jgi:hypothetical protein
MMTSRRSRHIRDIPSMVEKRNAYRIFVGNPEGKRPVSRPRRE